MRARLAAAAVLLTTLLLVQLRAFPARAATQSQSVVYRVPAPTTVSALARHCHTSSPAIRELNDVRDKIAAGARIRLEPPRWWIVRERRPAEILSQVAACSGQTVAQLLKRKSNRRYRANPDLIHVRDRVDTGAEAPRDHHKKPTPPTRPVPPVSSASPGPSAPHPSTSAAAARGAVLVVAPTLAALAVGAAVALAIRRASARPELPPRERR
jgi:hypothetical protein